MCIRVYFTLPGRFFFCGSFVLSAVAAAVAALLFGQWTKELDIFRNNSPGVQWVNWVGEYSCGPETVIERPQTLEQLQSAVKKHASVRPAATGHSFNMFACPASTKGAVIDMRAFQKVKVVRPQQGSSEPTKVEVEAGITMGQLQNEILAKGLTLRIPPGNPAYTVGGCIATGCHNLGQSHAQDLQSVTFVLANGTIKEVKRGEPDFLAAAVPLGRLGIILSATLEVLPYRSLTWRSEELETPSTGVALDILEGMAKQVTSRENVGNKLVFYLTTGTMMMEHWVPQGRTDLHDSEEPLAPYKNPQVFRLGQGQFSSLLGRWREKVLAGMPRWILAVTQVPAEVAFKGLHTSPLLETFRQLTGWQHSPTARGEGTARPTGHQYTWAAVLDETFNLLLGLRHVEVIFPLEPKDTAGRCLDAVFAHKHLAWFRLNVRTMQSEDFYLSSVHGPKGKKVVFLRVDFVGPGALLDHPSGEASLTEQLRRDCPGWRKHWGKGLFAAAPEERWGEPEEFLKVAARYDPTGKFKSRNTPKWIS